MNRLLSAWSSLFLISLLMSAGFGARADEQMQTETLEISGVQMEACLVAAADFKTRGLSWENFSVRVTMLHDGVEVVFVPKQLEGQPNVRGGRTAYGREIHYLVSNAGKIEKIGFAR